MMLIRKENSPGTSIQRHFALWQVFTRVLQAGLDIPPTRMLASQQPKRATARHVVTEGHIP
jgi:hypothetical protein